MEKMQQTSLSPSDCQQTYDFATMYTMIELDSLKKQMKEYAKLVFEYAKANYGNADAMILPVKCCSGPRWARSNWSHKNTNGTKVITPVKNRTDYMCCSHVGHEIGLREGEAHV